MEEFVMFDVMDSNSLDEEKNLENVEIGKLIDEFLNKDRNYNGSEITALAEYVNYNFPEIEKTLRDKLIIKLSNFELAASDLSSIILENFKVLDKNISDSIFKIAENPSTSKDVGAILQYKYYSLPSDFRNKLLDRMAVNEKSIVSIANIINESFNKIPENTLIRLLDEMATYNETQFYQAKVLKYHFSKVPENIRDRMLLNLSDIDKMTKHLTFIVRENIHSIPGSIIGQVMLKLIDRRQYNKFSSYIIKDYFQLIDSEYQIKLIEKFLENKEHIRTINNIMVKHQAVLPEEFCYQIFKQFIDNDEVPWGVVGCIISNFDLLTNIHVEELLLNLSEKQEFNEALEHIIKVYQDKISDNTIKKIKENLGDNQ